MTVPRSAMQITFHFKNMKSPELRALVRVEIRALKSGLFAGKLPDVEWWQSNTEWKSMVSSCTLKMRTQVQMELTASMTYLAMVCGYLEPSTCSFMTNNSFYSVLSSPSSSPSGEYI